ncbi:MAG: Endonuclease NucS [Firmicutes bacterium]|nr:Endonuclease NucS [Bacillota bacterium]
MLDQKAFDNETLLQDVVERFPEVIALDDLGVTKPFIVIGREVATKAGYIDVLCIDGDGILTVIETKLARNSQIRREVVGQVLEYVAQLSKWRAHDVVQSANQYFASTGVKVGERTATLMDLLVTEQEEESGTLPMDLYDKIENNLRKGIVKLVIASDSIPETLKDTVTFINSFSNFDIYVLQIQSYQKDQLQIYAPTVFGFTHKTTGGVTSDKIQWDEESFFKSLSNLAPEAVQTIQKLYAITQKNAAGIRWGTGRSSSSSKRTEKHMRKD